MRRHRPVRVWFMPWKTKCACGCGWFPCPDAVTMAAPPITQSLHPGDPRWNGPTAYHSPGRGTPRPLMTRGQQWRSRER